MPFDSATPASTHAFPLALAAEGEKLRIAALVAGKNVERRLADLGLPVGSEIEVLHRQGPGRMVVGKGYARIALGVGLTAKIMVTLADGCERCPRAAA
jgi:ferrous iron transport protein A